MAKNSMRFVVVLLLFSSTDLAQAEILPSCGLFTSEGFGVPYWDNAKDGGQAVPGDCFSFHVEMPKNVPSLSIVIRYHRRGHETSQWIPIKANSTQDTKKRYVDSFGNLVGQMTVTRSGMISIFVPHSLKKTLDTNETVCYTISVYRNSDLIEGKISLGAEMVAIASLFESSNPATEGFSVSSMPTPSPLNVSQLPDHSLLIETPQVVRVKSLLYPLPDWKIMLLVTPNEN